jgi:aminoglycoside phosphotransferase (APT) family kinase protein
MNEKWMSFIVEASGAKSASRGETIQRLWSGYGEIIRINLEGGAVPSVVVKHIALPDQVDHPRGWATQHSHARKIKSYDVEMSWYERWARQCEASAIAVPACFGIEADESECLIILEDLNSSGYSRRCNELDRGGVSLCLEWLANFHAAFLGQTPTDLWSTGTYWHLQTRPDEWAAMPDQPLKQHAAAIDAALNNGQFKTFVHGDAKLANFCFTPEMDQVAAVDFQYVGGGCGIKDVVYFIGSCVDEEHCELWESSLLNDYFSYLQDALICEQKEIDFPALEAEWRQMYVLAWADFNRFLIGWMPDHQKHNTYSASMTKRAISTFT